MEQAINEALENKEIVIWFQEYLDNEGSGEYLYKAMLYSPFERLLKMNSHISMNKYQAGYVFYSYISLDNDEEILKQHGRIEICSYDSLPVITKFDWQGTWVAIDIDLSGKRDGLSNGKKITITSELGEIPEDGGDYLIFVLFMKKIFNSGFSLQQKKEWIDVGYRTTGQNGQCFEKYFSLIGENIDDVMEIF